MLRGVGCMKGEGGGSIGSREGVHESEFEVGQGEKEGGREGR